MSQLSITSSAVSSSSYLVNHAAPSQVDLEPSSNISLQHDPRPDLSQDSHLWELVLSALAEDIEPYSILKSLRFAGAYIDIDRIVWRHLDLVMAEEDVLEGFLMPLAEAIRAALSQLVQSQAA
ncbi:MAG: hypothetical protein AAF267_19730 [Deinococcota bacterium]